MHFIIILILSECLTMILTEDNGQIFMSSNDGIPMRESICSCFESHAGSANNGMLVRLSYKATETLVVSHGDTLC